MNKLLLPATIIIASLILGGFFYTTQIKKQESIERQHQQDLLSQQRIAEINNQQQPDKTPLDNSIPKVTINPTTKQNNLLDKQNDTPKLKTPQQSNETSHEVTINKDNLFEKKVSCQKYKTEIEEKFNNQTSVSVFYSTLVNSCVYENIGIKNGKITFKTITDVLNDKTYVFEQGEQYFYDTNLFGANKTYSDILNALKGL